MRIPLAQGAYSARSVIASAQRCVNLYAENNPSGTILELQSAGQPSPWGTGQSAEVPAPRTYYPAPGLRLLGTPPIAGPARGLYWANSGALYYVCGNTLYTVSPSWAFTTVGTIDVGSAPVSMADNGTLLGLMDGTSNGYQVTLATGAFAPISATNNSPPAGSGAVYAFYGADRVDMLDGFMLFNQPGTQNFYCTYNNEMVFDALYFAAKNGYSDPLVSVLATRREIWLIGQRTTEIWFDAGAANFPFQIVPGPFIQHGCSAKYSVAQINGAVYWLSQDQAGQNIMVRAEGYEAARVSTHAIETEWSTYSTTADAVGFCFQQNGHPFYQINFPTADRSWRYDESTQEWHEAVYVDANGVEHRHLAQCAIFAYGLNIVGDWQTGALYALDPGAYTDNGAPMQWRRGWPHLMNDGKRVGYTSFSADMQCGEAPGGTVGLRWSDDRGRTYGNPVQQSMGATGQYLAQPKWNRLGLARDRVFELYGTIPGPFALNGAFIEVQGFAT